MKRYPKNKVLLALLSRINYEAQSGIFSDHRHYCPQCRRYRFDPLLNRHEAGAYVNFAPNTMNIYDSTGRYDFKPVKLDNAVRYHLSSLNQFADQRIRPSVK